MASSHRQNDYPWPSTVNVANFISAKLCFKDESTNYKIWKKQMLCLIEGQDLLGFIDGSILPPQPETHQENYLRWRRSDRLLMGWLLGSLDETLVSEVVAMTTARDVWLELENKFSPIITANTQYKRREVNSITHELSQFHNARPRGFIYRVHEPLRNVNSKAYDPEILAIGPYHRDKCKYRMMEEHKLGYFKSILDRKEKDTPERYISAIGELEEEARNFYAEPINLSQDEFIKLLILDGCFIIELALKFEKLNNTSETETSLCSDDPIFKMGWIQSSLTMDLMLFENQIPFFVLCKLFDLIEEPGPNQYRRLIQLLLGFCLHLFPDINYRKEFSWPADIKHLLALIYSFWAPHYFVVAVNINEDNPILVNSEQRFIHSAAELKGANVKFRKKEPCDSLFEVKFEKGTLLMPPLKIVDGTDRFFRNLIAYEQYFQFRGTNYVTDYVLFIFHLINSSKDVDVLLKCGIIHNCLGDHEVIADTFNKLLVSVVVSTKNSYGNTCKEINTYYNKRRNKWMAVLNRDYFSSPWGCISLFAALVLLLLTIIQTVCSILQVV